MKEIVFAGFGGQGVLTSGLIVSDAVLAHGMYATWIPSYGAEMRGGRAYCVVKADPVKVGTPALEEADIVLAMNGPSLTFADNLRPGGILLVNSDIIGNYRVEMTRTDIRVEEIPFDTLARSVNNPKGANVIAAGVVLSLMCVTIEEEISLSAMNLFLEQNG
ncbi:MAG: 2-oxoacid:acceptor oxidoreductase family protein [Clostridiales bacterium]|nr:2-oxoacid:acceptor oxidoreductase family protein [Clostridiales bacterium]